MIRVERGEAPNWLRQNGVEAIEPLDEIVEYLHREGL